MFNTCILSCAIAEQTVTLWQLSSIATNDFFFFSAVHEPFSFFMFHKYTICYKVLDTLFSEQAYLGAIIVYLYAHDFKQAEKCYNDCSQ